MPGRGAAGTAGVGGLVRRATMSGRGGTTGRAAGCPAKFGFAGGRSGLPPPIGGVGKVVPAGACGRATGRRGVEMLGTDGVGRGGPGTALGAPPIPGDGPIPDVVNP